MNVIGRSDAKNCGQVWFFTGIPCKHGHLAKRNTNTTKCLECLAVKAKEYRASHDSQRLYNTEYRRKQRQESPEWFAEKEKARYQSDTEYHCARAHAYRVANPERGRQTISEWRRNNPGKAREYNSARRARLRNAQGSFTVSDLLQLHTRQRGKCASCLKAVDQKWHADHVVSLAKGGRNDIYNIQILCPPCNLRKGTKDPINFAHENGRLL